MMAACDFTHTLVVTQDGALWACGFGGDGQLGLNDVVNRHMFERVGARTFGGARVVAAAAGLDGAWGRADRAVPGAAGGARAGVCDGHARMAGGGLARAVPSGGLRMIVGWCRRWRWVRGRRGGRRGWCGCWAPVVKTRYAPVQSLRAHTLSWPGQTLHCFVAS